MGVFQSGLGFVEELQELVPAIITDIEMLHALSLLLLPEQHARTIKANKLPVSIEPFLLASCTKSSAPGIYK